MKKDFNVKRRPLGSEKMNEPKAVGRVLIEYLESDEPLAVEFRHWKERSKAAQVNDEHETNQLFENIFPHTELGIDLKLFTLKPGRICKGEFLAGMLSCDSEDRFCFVQNAKKEQVVKTRNPQVYKGTCINVNQQPDGSLYPSLNRPCYSEDYTFKHFCLRAAEEMLLVADLLGGKKG